MKTYYIHWGSRERGPYSIDQLREMQLKPAVLVWTQGLKQWIKAIDIPELQQELFSASTGNAGSEGASTKDRIESAIEKAGYTLGRHWKKTLAGLIALVVGFLVLKVEWKTAIPAKMPVVETPALSPVVAEAKQHVSRKQAVSPVSYLRLKSSSRKNLIGETVLDGSLQNISGEIDFKNALVKISWLSKNGAEMQTNRHLIDNYIPAGKTTRFKLKLRGPSKHADVKVSLVAAARAG